MFWPFIQQAAGLNGTWLSPFLSYSRVGDQHLDSFELQLMGLVQLKSSQWGLCDWSPSFWNLVLGDKPNSCSKGFRVLVAKDMVLERMDSQVKLNLTGLWFCILIWSTPKHNRLLPHSATTFPHVFLAAPIKDPCTPAWLLPLGTIHPQSGKLPEVGKAFYSIHLTHLKASTCPTLH